MRRHFFPRGLRAAAEWRSSRRGQTLVEYALIIAVIAIVAVGTLISLGSQTKSLYSTIESQVARTGTGS